MGNSEWEYRNQDLLKSWYQEKIQGKKPNLVVRKIICKGCGREFYTQIKSKKYCLYHLCGNRGYRKELSERAREARKDRICKVCGKVFTPKRSDGVYCSNACRQKAYRQSVTDNQVCKKNTCLSVTEQKRIATCERSQVAFLMQKSSGEKHPMKSRSKGSF